MSADPDGHSVFGSFLRMFRPTTTQALNKGVPTALLKNSKDRAASVRPLSSKDVERLDKVVKLREQQRDKVASKIHKWLGESDVVQESNEKHGSNSFQTLSNKVLADADTDVKDAKALYNYARDYVGKLGITKESSINLKNTALEYDKKVAAIRKQGTQGYRQLQQDWLYRDNQRAPAGVKPSSKKRVHQTPNYKG